MPAIALLTMLTYQLNLDSPLVPIEQSQQQTEDKMTDDMRQVDSIAGRTHVFDRAF